MKHNSWWPKTKSFREVEKPRSFVAVGIIRFPAVLAQDWRKLWIEPRTRWARLEELLYLRSGVGIEMRWWSMARTHRW